MSPPRGSTVHKDPFKQEGLMTWTIIRHPVIRRVVVRQAAFRAVGFAAVAILLAPEVAHAQNTFPLLNTGSTVTWNTAPWTLSGSSVQPPQTATQIGLLQGGGTMTIDDTSTNTTPAGLLIGWNGNFSVAVTSGTLTVGATSGDAFGTFGLTVGESGPGLGQANFTQTGGLVTAPLVNLGRQGGASVGTYTLTGGTLATAVIQRRNGSGVLNLNGGTIMVSGSAANLVASLITTNVQAGGGFIDTNGFNATIAAPLAGVGGLTKLGTGTLTLSGSNSYLGNTSISAGSLAFTSDASQTLSGAISGAGGLTKSGSGTLTLSGSNSYSGNTTISAGAVQIGNGGTTGSISGNAAVSAGAALTFNRSDDLIYGGIVSGAGGLAKLGAGTLTLSASNSYTGLTTISAGTLQNGSTTAATTNVNEGNYSVASGARLVFGRNIDDFRFTAQSISGAGDVEFVGQAAGYFTFRTVGPPYSGSLTYTGRTIVNLTSSTSALWYQNALWLEKDNVLPNQTVLELQSGKVITRSQAASGLTVAGLTGNAGTRISTDQSSANIQKWTINVASGTSYTFAGSIGSFGSPTTNNIALTKTGAGTQILSGSNPYTGGTTITGGRLEIAPAGGLAATGTVTINGLGADFQYNASTALTAPLTFTQGTISGTGTIGTAVNVGSGRIISPGNSPGVQAYASGLTWSPGGAYTWEINDAAGVAGTNWDLLQVSGSALNLSGLSSENRFNLDLTTLLDTVGGQMMNYVDGQSYTFSLATYASLVLPAGFSGNDLTSLFNPSFANWQNPAPSVANVSIVNDAATGTINLVIVPEPSAIALLAAAAAAAALPRVRRRTRGT